jgi:hypothetical protein
LPVALGALLDGVIALLSLRRETACLHAVGRDAGSDERVTNVADARWPSRVVLIGTALKIRGAVDAESDGRILDLRSRSRETLLISDGPDLCLVEVEAMSFRGSSAQRSDGAPASGHAGLAREPVIPVWPWEPVMPACPCEPVIPVGP